MYQSYCNDRYGTCEEDHCRCNSEQTSEIKPMINLINEKIENDFKIMFAPEEDEKEVEPMTEQELNDTFAKLHPDSKVNNEGENNEYGTPTR